MRGALRLFEGFGVELEYMIADRRSLAVRPIADRLFREAAGRTVSDVERDGIGWSNELVLHVIELKTLQPRRSFEGLAGELQANVRALNALLAGFGARLLPTGAHPLMDPLTETRLWPHESGDIYAAYDRIFGCRGHGWANLQSLHLNLPFRGDEEFGRLHAAVRLLLPILPALAASTPVLEGRVTGLKDTRLEVYRLNQRRVPSVTGRVIPERAFSRREYRRRILEPMYRQIAPLDPQGILQHEWLNSRGAAARFERSAIEIRLLDMQECPAADLAVARAAIGALRALVAGAWQPYERQKEAGEEELAALLQEVARDGEEARIRNRGYLQAFGLEAAGGEGTTARELWRHILARCAREGFLPGDEDIGGEDIGGEDIGDEDIAGESEDQFAEGGEDSGDPVRLILAEGSLASRILAALGPAPSRERILGVYRRLADCLEENRLFRPSSGDKGRDKGR